MGVQFGAGQGVGAQGQGGGKGELGAVDKGNRSPRDRRSRRPDPQKYRRRGCPRSQTPEARRKFQSGGRRQRTTGPFLSRRPTSRASGGARGSPGRGTTGEEGVEVGPGLGRRRKRRLRREGWNPSPGSSDLRLSRRSQSGLSSRYDYFYGPQSVSPGRRAFRYRRSLPPPGPARLPLPLPLLLLPRG